MNLRCRLRAYAKLTAKIGSGEGGDDFLKKIITTSSDDVIDLGYKDALSGKEVYAVRRHFSYTLRDSKDVYVIRLGENIESVFSFFGNVNCDGLISNNPHDSMYTIEDNKIRLNFYTEDDSQYMDHDYTFDAYFVFTCTEDGADIGRVELETYRFDLHTIGENCEVEVVDTNTMQIVEDGEGVLKSGTVYQVYVTTTEGYQIKSIRLNGNIIFSGDTFTCTEDVSIVALAEKVVSHFNLSRECTNCTVTVVDTATATPIEDGEGVLEEGRSYTIFVTADYGYTLKQFTINGDSKSSPVMVTCDGNIYIYAYATPENKYALKIRFHAVDIHDTSISGITVVYDGEEYVSDENGIVDTGAISSTSKYVSLSCTDYRAYSSDYDYYYSNTPGGAAEFYVGAWLVENTSQSYTSVVLIKQFK